MDEFRSWSYHEARAHLWKEKQFPETWKPGKKPPSRFYLYVDDVIEGLPLRSDMQSFPETVITDMTVGRALAEFCPFREMRAHWIPFALEIARFEEKRHQQRSRSNGDVVADIRRAAKALERLCRHDEYALASVGKPLLASWRFVLKNNKGPEPERYASQEDIKRLKDGFAYTYASTAKGDATVAERSIKELREFNASYQKKFKVPRSDSQEWRIAFAGTLGFAWYRLTKMEPTKGSTSAFCNFVRAAYQSIDDTTEIDWDHPCQVAIDRYGDNFVVIDRDITLNYFAWSVWREINDWDNHLGQGG